RKEALSSGNIYTFDLMTAQERNSLLHRLQRPLSPTGIEGYAYQSRILYSMKAYEGQKVFDPISLHGVLIDEHLRGVIPIPEKGGRVRIQFDQAYGENLVDVEENIMIRWYGRKISERSLQSVAWSGTSAQFEQFFAGGLLEISANQPVVARVFLEEGDTSLDITPETVYLRGYVADEEASVIYQVAHSSDDATPFRVDFRYIKALTSTQEADSAPTIVYDLMDAQDSIIKQGRIPLISENSFYDRIAGEINHHVLSDPISRYISLPKQVTQVKFKSDSPALIFAYNRPAELIHEIKIPEYSYISALDEWNQPAWFPVRPRDYEDLILRNQSILLTIQPRPPEDKPDLLAGRYQWEDYHPQGNWFARTVFTPLDDAESIREEAFVSVYRPITLGKSESFEFYAPQGVTNIMPNLAYFRHEEQPFDISIFIDDDEYFHRRVDGLQGEIQLPALMAGQRRIKVTTSAPANILLSHSRPAPGGFLKRLVNRFEHNKMRFIYEREHLEEESLSVRLYTPYGKKKRSSVSVQIETIEPLPLNSMQSWSLAARRFDVRSGSMPIPVMGTQNESVDYGYPFFITLGEDLPVGRYHIIFALEEGLDSYLSLSKVTPGVFQEREIFYETEALHVKAIK
ncbi:MAG: hypothetical protein OEX82_03575, partial [Nitrosomonas sp.]|nr:hypothetical protein [Nitrosomonas sp.]